MDNKINTFVISYNRLTFLKQVVEKLMQEPELNIIIIDNNSSYAPLLKYLKSLPEQVKVFNCGRNVGHKVVWELEFSRFYSLREPYIVTDCDVLPVGDDWLKLLQEGLKYAHSNKVGLGLSIDDIPDYNPLKAEIIRHESSLFKYAMADTRFVESPVDTTLAIYRAGYHNYSIYGANKGETEGRCKAMRTLPPFCAKHLPWYMTQEEINSEEHQFYIKSLKDGSTHWSVKQK